MDAILTRLMNKDYGKQAVVRDLNLTIPKGSIYGFIGKNGAGKSTTQKMACGLTYATSGELKIFGQPIQDENKRRKIGSLIEQPGIYLNMSTFSNVLMQAYNLGLEKPREVAVEVLRTVGLEEASNKKAKNLSLGMKQRLGLAIALIGTPDLLILDEPINGLDPEGIVEFREIMERLHKNGMTIFISSHILGELTKIATHYGIINDGVLVEEMTAEELFSKRKSFLDIKVNSAKDALELLKKEFQIQEYELVSEKELYIFDSLTGGEINVFLAKNSLQVEEISTHHQDLEEYFLGLMGGSSIA